MEEEGSILPFAKPEPEAELGAIRCVMAGMVDDGNALHREMKKLKKDYPKVFYELKKWHEKNYAAEVLEWRRAQGVKVSAPPVEVGKEAPGVEEEKQEEWLDDMIGEWQ